MTARDLLIALRHAPLDAEVYFDSDDGPMPVNICSWRRDGDHESVWLAEYDPESQPQASRQGPGHTFMTPLWVTREALQMFKDAHEIIGALRQQKPK